jgi:hypothetical protein
MKVAAGVGGLALFIYVLYRAVLAAKRRARTGSAEPLGLLLTFLGPYLLQRRRARWPPNRES